MQRHVSECGFFAHRMREEIMISYASIMGIQKDIGLNGDNYLWLGSTFYLVGCAPSVSTVKILIRLSEF